jgi:hypothetical protein
VLPNDEFAFAVQLVQKNSRAEGARRWPWHATWTTLTQPSHLSSGASSASPGGGGGGGATASSRRASTNRASTRHAAAGAHAPPSPARAAGESAGADRSAAARAAARKKHAAPRLSRRAASSTERSGSDGAAPRPAMRQGAWVLFCPRRERSQGRNILSEEPSRSLKQAQLLESVAEIPKCFRVSFLFASRVPPGNTSPEFGGGSTTGRGAGPCLY